MKALIALLISAVAYAQQPQVNGSNNNINICQPKIEVKTCGSCCHAKPRIVVKTKVVEKVVKVPVEAERAVVIEREVIVEKKVEKRVVKKHILSLFAHRAVVGGSESTTNNNHSSHAEVRTGLVPGMMYQFQFNRGLVLMIGIDATLNRTGGIGIEF